MSHSSMNFQEQKAHGFWSCGTDRYQVREARTAVLLLQQLQLQQQLMKKAFAEIHNSPVQILAFLIREVEIRQVPPTRITGVLA
ncbi:MAG: hypothetical protein HC773_24040 [Scytonema sp. CRU_2_7]|nr:hypothetical protein [Scytonema sp. CRU_2_7]